MSIAAVPAGSKDGRVGVPGREQAMRTQQKVIVVGAGHNVRPEVKWLADLLQHGLLVPALSIPLGSAKCAN